jgi:hypothetical protein
VLAAEDTTHGESVDASEIAKAEIAIRRNAFVRGRWSSNGKV